MPDIYFNSTNLENLKVGDLRAKYSAAGDRVLRYYIDFRHMVLDLHKEVSAPELDILQNKVDALVASWDKKYAQHLVRSDLAEGKELAESMTLEFENQREKLKNILTHTLSVDDMVNWEILKDHSIFEVQTFYKPKPMAPVQVKNKPKVPNISFFQKIFGKKDEIIAEYQHSVREFEKYTLDRATAFSKNLKTWEIQKNEWEIEREAEKNNFIEKQTRTNNRVEMLKEDWIGGNPEAIIEHVMIVLDASEYDETISQEYEVEFDSDNQTLLVDYLLPSPDDLPATKIVRFVSSTGELKETPIAAKDKKALFDDVCYQVCLRTIHEIFEADNCSHIQQVLFNGTSKYVDRGTGQEVHSTILSLMVNRNEFLSIDLSRVDPKTCFKNLKGVSAASLVGLSPIAPIMELNKSDKRFIDARGTNIGSDGLTNLAAMDWEEFEHLVREIFDKEFSLRGGEVKITQSSSDGGVDAIAFDPDPISGGKIIIQAKRYTKTVGVAAVRDLYGTTMNEGANKGILVTTSDYGPDAYKFAADKPLTLMTGANLLHLLSNHGINAKIDLKEARKELGLSE